MEHWIPLLAQVKSFLGTAFHQMSLAGQVLQPVLKNLWIVMLGGSLGAVSRYGMGLLAAKVWGSQFPWGTLIVNLIGCFLIGLIFALATRFRVLSPDMRLLLITGYLGALTTFSSFSLETVNAVRAGLALQPLVNILVNNIGGLALTFLGLWLGGMK